MQDEERASGRENMQEEGGISEQRGETINENGRGREDIFKLLKQYLVRC